MRNIIRKMEGIGRIVRKLHKSKEGGNDLYSVFNTLNVYKNSAQLESFKEVIKVVSKKWIR